MGQDGSSDSSSFRPADSLGAASCLLVCSAAGIHRLSIQNGRPFGAAMKLPRGTSAISAVQVSETEIVVGAMDCSTPVLFDAVSGACLELLVGSEHQQGRKPISVFGVSFLARAQLLVSGASDGMINVWNRQRTAGTTSTDTNQLPYFGVRCLMEGHTDAVNILDARQDGSNVAVSGSADRTARVWDVSRESCVAVLKGHSNSVQGLCHDSEKQIQFTAGSIDKTVIGWDWRTNQKIVSLGPFPGAVCTLCYRQKRAQLGVPCSGGILQVISTRMLGSGTTIKSSVLRKWHGHRGSVYGSCDVSFFATSGHDDRHIKTWTETGKCVWDWHCPSANPWGISPFGQVDPDADPSQTLVSSSVLAAEDSAPQHEEKGESSSVVTPRSHENGTGTPSITSPLQSPDDGETLIGSLLTGTLSKYHSAFLREEVGVDLLPDLLDDDEMVAMLIPNALHRRVFLKRLRKHLIGDATASTADGGVVRQQQMMVSGGGGGEKIPDAPERQSDDAPEYF